MNIISHITLYLITLYIQFIFILKNVSTLSQLNIFKTNDIFQTVNYIFIRQSVYINIIYLRMLHNIDRTNALYPSVQISGCNHCRLNSSRCESSLRSTFPRRSSQKNRVVCNSNDA